MVKLRLKEINVYTAPLGSPSWSITQPVLHMHTMCNSLQENYYIITSHLKFLLNLGYYHGITHSSIIS
jgi:hypothetical protein